MIKNQSNYTLERDVAINGLGPAGILMPTLVHGFNSQRYLNAASR